MNSYNVNQYRQNQISTASPEQILLMLYDGAIRFVRIAIDGIETKKPAEKCRGISKATAIITEFSNSLNHEIGGKIAEDLDALYSFMIRELSSALLNNDTDKLRTVETLLVDLRETWEEAIELQKKEMAANVAAMANDKETAHEAYGAHTPVNQYQPFDTSR